MQTTDNQSTAGKDSAPGQAPLVVEDSRKNTPEPLVEQEPRAASELERGEGVGGLSVRFDGHIDSHPMHMAIYELMQEIEKLPASVQATKCVTLAGELQDRLATLRCIARSNAKMLLHYGAECFPKAADGKIHFARAIMESAAEELDQAFSPKMAGRAAAVGESPSTPETQRKATAA